jgi:LDH2 family malate/lactate/ureidoglycolate dehydrogenase
MNHLAADTLARRPADNLTALARDLFAAAGLDADKAATVAGLLVFTDMMGRPTHGLAQTGAYLEQVLNGGMTRTGTPETVRDLGGTVVWDGNYLPGLWLMQQALELGFSRIAEHGVVTLAMRRSHHIGCLAAFAKQATDRGLFAMIASSGPHTKAVAPYGGKQGLFSPNPFAVGFPTTAEPVLVDICASITTISNTREKTAAGELFAHDWVLDHQGRPSRDPSVVERQGERGSLMLLGGVESGHKGFGLALMVEALTQGLAGYGRKDAPTRWGASVYLQLIDPAAFAGRDAFIEQTEFFAEQCRANAPIDPALPVRLPGERADRSIATSRRDGVPLSLGTLNALQGWADRLGVDAGALR